MVDVRRVHTEPGDATANMRELMKAYGKSYS
jgi:hypothetical protein